MILQKDSFPVRFLCFALACVILSLSVCVPVSASALVGAVAAPIVGISPVAAIAGILVCLGIAGVTSSGFQNLCQDLADSIPDDFLVSVNAKSMVEGILHNDITYLPQNLINWVNNRLFYSSEPLIKLHLGVINGYPEFSNSLYAGSNHEG